MEWEELGDQDLEAQKRGFRARTHISEEEVWSKQCYLGISEERPYRNQKPGFRLPRRQNCSAGSGTSKEVDEDGFGSAKRSQG